MRPTAALLVGLACLGIGPAAAADAWSTAPLGTSLGLPTGVAPPPGLYLDLSTANAVPLAAPGPAANPAATVGLTYVPGIKILGADYSASIRPAELTPFSYRR